MNDTDALLGPWVQRFLVHHLVTERNLSRNTCKSYRDTFKLLVPFACAELGKQDYQLTVPNLSSELVRRFLDHLEDERGCCTHTRNLRLTAIRAFARFVASRDPAHVVWRGQISAIASKKTKIKPVAWLSVDEMHALLDVPDRTTRHGRIEHAILLFLYKTGARASEATQLRVGDLQVGRRDGGHALVTLHGKGGKVRQCPLRPEIERVMVELVDGRAADDAVFLNRRRQPFTRFGVYSVVERCAAQVPALAGRKITPHALRHTTACHLVFAGVDINTVRAWLGHSSIDTTNIYAEINLKMKAAAMALCDVAEPDPGRHWKEPLAVDVLQSAPNNTNTPRNHMSAEVWRGNPPADMIDTPLPNLRTATTPASARSIQKIFCGMNEQSKFILIEPRTCLTNQSNLTTVSGA